MRVFVRGTQRPRAAALIPYFLAVSHSCTAVAVPLPEWRWRVLVMLVPNGGGATYDTTYA